ncbi:MAG: PRC-barrel domain-containing protein [Xanthomonadales bacterium]
MSELSGMPVHGPDGEKLGRIEDISIDVRGGAIEGALLRLAASHRGRPLTIDLPWSLLRLDADGHALELDIGLPTLVAVINRRRDGR